MTSYNRRKERWSKALRSLPRRCELTESPDGLPCRWCGRPMKSTRAKGRLAATRDHVKPKSQGGIAVVWACRACNEVKRDMGLDEWQRFMERNPRWWKKITHA